MNESHETEISQMMDEMLKRLHKEMQTTPPQHLPSLTNCVVQLYQLKAGVQGNAERNMVEITLLKNINRQINNFERGEGYGGNQVTER